MIFDAETLYAYFVSNSRDHWAVAGEVEMLAAFENLEISPLVILELESLILERIGAEGWFAVLDELGGGAWTIVPLDLGELRARAS